MLVSSRLGLGLLPSLEEASGTSGAVAQCLPRGQALLDHEEGDHLGRA